MKRGLMGIAVALGALALGGCAVYPVDGYYGAYGPQVGVSVGVPAPVIVTPGVSVRGYWGGHRHRHSYRHDGYRGHYRY